MAIAPLVVLVLVALVAAPARAQEVSPVSCRSAQLSFSGADIDRVVDREAIRAHLRDAGITLIDAEADADLSLRISASWGTMRTSDSGYFQTCVYAAASYRPRGAPDATILAESCPQSTTEMTADFARSGAADQWSASARGRFTALTRTGLDKALMSLQNGVTIATVPPGAAILRNATLAEGVEGAPQISGGQPLARDTPLIIGCLRKGDTVTGVLTKDGYQPAAFDLPATPEAAQPQLVLVEQTPVVAPSPPDAEPEAEAPAGELTRWLPWIIGGGVGALLLIAVQLLRRRRSENNSGDAVGSYTLIEPLGMGGMGEVWRAQHATLGRPAAVKLVRTEISDSNPEGLERVQQRFEKEAMATAALRSPHTIELYDYGTTRDGSFYYAMELLQGMELESLVNEFGPVPAPRMIHLISQACSALDEAHGAGLIHRDIKPANIFASCLGTSYDFVKVLDFGIVKSSAQRATNLTGVNAVVGTPAFLAPETVSGVGEIDGRVDIYGLGCIAYWLLTGSLVFEGEINRLLYDHVNTAPEAPSRRTELEIPDDVEAVVLSCLEKSPGARPERPSELATALAACECAGEWTSERAASWWRKHAPSVFA